ncbi:MAG: ATP-binding cassette domain-containing protein [Cyanobacteriota bacterium]|nr:ATP-binding cassette domain-containing protein [Cyanobacteriota bacterium]
MNQPLLQARDLAYAYARVPVLVGIDLEVTPGSCSVIRGDNGSGKSTLLHVLQGRLRPSSGWVRLEGRPLRGQRRRVALVPQAPRLNWGYPIRLEAFVALAANGKQRCFPPVLRQVGLEALAERPIGSLSSGQRQRALIARALAQRAAVLLLDEPLACLDRASCLQLGALLRSLVTSGTAVVLSAHGELPPTLPRLRTYLLERGSLHPQPAQPSLTPWQPSANPFGCSPSCWPGSAD